MDVLYGTTCGRMVGVEMISQVMTSQLMMSYSRDIYVQDAYEHEQGIPFMLSKQLHGEEDDLQRYGEYIMVENDTLDLDEWTCMQEQLVAEWLVRR